MPVTNIIICTLLTAIFLMFFLPVEKLIKKVLDLNIDRITTPLVLLFVIIGAAVFTTGLVGILYLALSVFCLWVFIFGFLTNRRYPYTLALVFLVLCPFLLIAKQDKIAEFFAVLCYLCLVFGVFKDILYDKIVDGDSND